MRRKFVPIALTLAVVLLALDVALRLDEQAHAQPQVQIAPRVVAAEIHVLGANTAGFRYRIIRTWSDGATEAVVVFGRHHDVAQPCLFQQDCEWQPLE